MRSPDPIDVLDGIEPFTAANGQAFLAVRDFSAGTSSLPVRSLAFRNWFTLRFWNRYQAVPSPQALNTAMRYLESMAEFAGDGCQKLQVARRLSAIGIGRLPIRVFLDRNNESRQAVRIDSSGWTIVESAAPSFQVSRHQAAVPAPVSAAALDSLRSALNLPA